MNELKKAVASVDEETLTALANKGIYKRACKDIDGVIPEITDNGDTAEVNIGGEKVTLKSPLSECKCSCVSRNVCRHIISAILLMKKSLSNEQISETESEPAPEKEKTPVVQETAPESSTFDEVSESKLTEKQIAKINKCAEQTISAMADILRRGLVRVPDTLAENLEISAVRCHSLRMADAERLVREIGGRLGDCIARRASFSIKSFTQKYCDTLKMLFSLTEDDISNAQLGVFKQKYEQYNGLLTLLPVGQRTVSGGEYEGDVYYFLNLDETAEQRFFSLSDIRPVFYESSKSKKAWFPQKSSIMPWGISTPLKNMMKSVIVLGNAKTSGGKLSASQETQVVMQKTGTLDCSEVRNLICDDFAQIIVELSERNPESETDKLFFVHPRKCISSEFDKYTQNYIMFIEDFSGRIIPVKVKYREETKNLISGIEKIAKKMLENPQKDYVLLVTAYIENGRLNLFPIEFYDFIRPNMHKEYELPDEFIDNRENAYYAERILSLLDEVRGRVELTLQCGLQSGLAKDKKLENTAFNYGLKGLSRMISEFMSAAENYRHGNNASMDSILHTMVDILGYINTARKKLELITALQ